MTSCSLANAPELMRSQRNRKSCHHSIQPQQAAILPSEGYSFMDVPLARRAAQGGVRSESRNRC